MCCLVCVPELLGLQKEFLSSGCCVGSDNSTQVLEGTCSYRLQSLFFFFCLDRDSLPGVHWWPFR